MNKKRVGILLIIVITIFVLHFSGGRDVITLARMQESLGRLAEQVRDHYVVSVLSFIAAFIGVAITLIPATILLNLLGGYLFGPFLGTIYILAASTVSAVILFCLARYLFRSWLTHRFSGQAVRFNNELRRHGLWYLIILNLMPFTPTPVLYLIAGISSVPLGIFLGANVIGLFPGTFLYAWLGHRLPHIKSLNELFAYDIVLLVLLAVVLFMLLPYWIIKHKKRRKLV